MDPTDTLAMPKSTLRPFVYRVMASRSKIGNVGITLALYSPPSIMLTLGSGSKLTFIEVLTINNYKITFLSNIQIFTFINISNSEESL